MSVAALPFTGSFTADPDHSLLQFTVAHMKVGRYSASFHDLNAHVVADEQGVRFEGAARVDSISIKNPDFRNHVVRGDDFFDADHHPEVTFRSTEVNLHEDGTAQVQGELTIKGITRPFTATGSYQQLVEDPFGGVHTAVELTATVDRRDWDLTWQAPLPGGGEALGYDVVLTVQLELVRQS